MSSDFDVHPLPSHLIFSCEIRVFHKRRCLLCDSKPFCIYRYIEDCSSVAAVIFYDVFVDGDVGLGRRYLCMS